MGSIFMDRPDTADLVILGGGLAGLALARQLHRAVPELSVTIVDAGEHPVPEAAFKVGESSVEIGADYLARTLGLREHLDTAHLKKFGLRCFFGDGQAIEHADELGASRALPVSAWQMDRGRLENHLYDCALADGVRVIGGASVSGVDFAADGKATIRYRRLGRRAGRGAGVAETLRSRRVVDASGRRGLLRKRLGLAQPSEHDGNAAWFRVDKQVCIDDWTADVQWHERVPGSKRWLSTNHLMGPGYWVWLIPLASGATSVGIVADAKHHPISSLHTHKRALDWLEQHQPQCREAVGADAMDFHRFRRYAYSSQRVFSGRRDTGDWCLTGEAGQFVDPFYSPGLDFIAYGNTYVTDLVSRDLRGEDTRARRLAHEHGLAAIHASTLELYRGQYGGFGNFRLMTLKTVWDYAYYWCVLGFLRANEALTDTELLTTHAAALAQARARHREVQAAFRTAAERQPVVTPQGRFADHGSMPMMRELNGRLAGPTDRPLGDAFKESLAELDRIGAAILPEFDEQHDHSEPPRWLYAELASSPLSRPPGSTQRAAS